MRLIYKENPGEWRKSALLTALGLAIISSLLRWRGHLPAPVWQALLALLGLVAVCAVLRPRWFRGWYRFSLWLGFYSSQYIGRCMLLVFFLGVLTPLGWALRRMGKDPLHVRRPTGASTYWQATRPSNPLDRLF